MVGQCEGKSGTSGAADGEEFFSVTADRGSVLLCPFVYLQGVDELDWSLVLWSKMVVSTDDDDGRCVFGDSTTH